MLKLLAQFFSTLAGTHKHDDINHEEMERLKRALEANKEIVRNQLVNFDKLKAEQTKKDAEHATCEEHLTQQLKDAVHDIDNAHAEIVSLKDRLREAQNQGTANLDLRKRNEDLQTQISVLEEDNEAAINLLDKFSKELQKS